MWCLSRKEVLHVWSVSKMLMGGWAASSMAWLSSGKLHGFRYETYFLYFFLTVSEHVLSADSGQAISRAG